MDKIWYIKSRIDFLRKRNDPSSFLLKHCPKLPPWKVEFQIGEFLYSFKRNNVFPVIMKHKMFTLREDSDQHYPWDFETLGANYRFESSIRPPGYIRGHAIVVQCRVGVPSVGIWCRQSADVFQYDQQQHGVIVGWRRPLLAFRVQLAPLFIVDQA